MTSTLRIVDANSNRAREAIRVMEESARFVLMDRELSEQLKRMRHDLAQALEPLGRLDGSRDTPGDVGTAITTEAEAKRETVSEVVRAAGKRLSEALRVIEEYAKVLAGPAPKRDVAGAIEALRYRGYEIERKLNQGLIEPVAPQWRVCLLLSEGLCTAHPWPTVLDQSIEGGVDCVQVREKRMSDRALLGRVEEVIRICRPRGVSVMVNDRADIALSAEADGVHLGQTDLPPDALGRWFGAISGSGVGANVVGLSTRDLSQAEAAIDQGVDYCALGPMFPTTTVTDKSDIVGPDYVERFRVRFPDMAHLAIGGITPKNIGKVVQAGARGIAVSSAICSAGDPYRAAADLSSAIRSLKDDRAF